METALQATKDKNKEIFKELLLVHQLMEQYTQNLQRIKKNSSQELQLLKDLDSMREMLFIQQSRLQEVYLHYASRCQTILNLRS
jgi:hypothetical protein